ncbi:hypothetical protein PG991_000773 [Apiospora marii]|uniref:Uncharacterized protein n=1 Tax=Apiospora marii TaxID=335849 RepID=A0ABR1SSY0_9PEZI
MVGIFLVAAGSSHVYGTRNNVSYKFDGRCGKRRINFTAIQDVEVGNEPTIAYGSWAVRENTLGIFDA